MLRDGRVDEIGTPGRAGHLWRHLLPLLALQASASKADRKRLRTFDITAASHGMAF